MRTLLWWLGLGALLVLLAQISGVRAQNPNGLDSAQRVQDACVEAGRVPGPYGCVERSNGPVGDSNSWKLFRQTSGYVQFGVGIKPPSFVIDANGPTTTTNPYITIYPDGTVKYDRNYTPDVAAAFIILLQPVLAGEACVPSPYGCVERSNGPTPDLRIQPSGGLSVGFPDPSSWLSNEQPSIAISAGKTYVTLRPDGTIIYGKGYTPDAAAKAFWDAVGIERKARSCP